MLRALHIRDFVIVDQADIAFDAGFTVFSGETGAGKSILIDALALALGGRGDAALIRQAAPRADISAVFDAPEAAPGWLAEQALDGPELILRRVIDSQGRSKAWINGVPATLGQLRDLGALLVDIHGQHAHQSLLQPASQRELLDTQGGHADQARALQQAWTDWRQAQAALDTARSAVIRSLRALVRRRPSLEVHGQTLESARIRCAETVSGLNAYADRLEADPDALAQADARMGRMFEAARRFHVEPEALAEHHETLRTQLRQAEAGQDLDALEQACRQAESRYTELARALSAARRTTAGQLAAQVTAAMQTLSMDGGVFDIALADCKPSAHGLETVEFLVAGHAGVPLRPLSRVASGGE